jgi:23S rRNA (cytosine1962-C5)-methyltransferase
LAASALGGASECLGVDASAKAVAAAEHNAQINGIANVRFQAGDGFKTLEQLAEAGEMFDAVVLDPPKFARSRGSLEEALRAYHWLNRLAVRVLAPGGILVTCSCSGHVSRLDFADMLVGVAQQSHRDIQILEQRGASPDHPVLTSCMEGEYLKCFVCRVI